MRTMETRGEKMTVTIDTVSTPAGVSLRAHPDGLTVGVWAGNREMIANLEADAVAQLARMLTERTGNLQLVGKVREFIAPRLD